MICNLDTSKVLIFLGQNEGDPRKEMITFKLVGEEKSPEEEDEEEKEEEQEEQEEGPL